MRKMQGLPACRLRGACRYGGRDRPGCKRRPAGSRKIGRRQGGVRDVMRSRAGPVRGVDLRLAVRWLGRSGARGAVMVKGASRFAETIAIDPIRRAIWSGRLASALTARFARLTDDPPASASEPILRPAVRRPIVALCKRRILPAVQRGRCLILQISRGLEVAGGMAARTSRFSFPAKRYLHRHERYPVLVPQRYGL